jgi:hypothetical protein
MFILNLYFPKRNSIFKTILSIESFYHKESTEKKFHIWQLKLANKNKTTFSSFRGETSKQNSITILVCCRISKKLPSSNNKKQKLKTKRPNNKKINKRVNKYRDIQLI